MIKYRMKIMQQTNTFKEYEQCKQENQRMKNNLTKVEIRKIKYVKFKFTV